MKFIISLLTASMAIGAAHADQTAPKKGAEIQAANNTTQQAVEMIEATTIALRGKPFYKPDFTQFNYVKLDVPLGGLIKDWAMGTFDNFNPYSRRGDPAKGASGLNSDLMGSSDDDLNAYYPLIAEKIIYAADYSQITFHINPLARF
ncbi:MAG: hypothetical protein ACPG47_04300, partial [Leucothrix sp.]